MFLKTLRTAAIVLSLCITAFATGPSIWTVNSRAEVLKGDSRGVSIDQNGTITLAPKLSEIYKTGQQYVWSSAVDRNGDIYLGTGGEGKVFKVDRSGQGTVLADLAEMNVTALVLGAEGEIFAGTSPDGKVYKIDAAGKVTEYFAPGEKYIWSLAVMSDRSVIVATGDGGRIYKVRNPGAAPAGSLLFDTSEAHIISLATDSQGNVYAGTDLNGLVMRFDAQGKPFGLLDSSLREIHELAVGPDGSVYVLALGESASVPKAPDAAATPVAAESRTVSVDRRNPAVAESPAKSRYDLTGAKTAVYRILPDGSVDLLWASTTITGFSLYAHQTGSGVLVGTSDKGRIYNIGNDTRETLVLQTGADQISTIRTDGRSLLASSSNPATLYRFGPDANDEGTYESAVLDARSTAIWGRIWWQSSGNVALQTRSGNTEKPDETWSGWSLPLTDGRGGPVASPKARYIQWRAILKPSVREATLTDVNLAFVPRNIAPEVLSLQVLPTNVGLLANPPVQIDPNIELSGLDPAAFGIPSTSVPPRRVYLRGATSLQWSAEDRNGDKLVYDIYYRETGETTAFKLLRAGLIDPFIALDGQSLADGRYVFKVVARDTPSNPASLALAGERLTEPVDIDNSAPVVTTFGAPQIAGERARSIFDVLDAASYISRAEYSVNGGDWMTVYPDDGIADGPKERYTVDVQMPASGEAVITFRAYDANANSGNARAIVRR